MAWFADVILIDGKNLLYRMASAMESLTHDIEDEALHTGGVHGFFNALIRLHGQHGCEIMVCWEGTKNFRATAYPDYKGNRAPAKRDINLSLQERWCFGILRMLGVHQLECIGGECDDVLATAAAVYNRRGQNAIIYTEDSDLRSVVNERTRVLCPNRERGPEILYTPAAVQEKYGIAPELLADMKALAGDSSDNIPGVPGIGIVTATKMIQAYGTAEEILDRASTDSKWSFSPRYKRLLVEHTAKVKLYKTLTTVQSAVTIIDIDGHEDKPGAHRMLAQLGCFDLAHRIDKLLELSVTEDE